VTSAPVLDLDNLLKPIAGANPAGEPLSDMLRMELDTLRREPVPGDDTTAHWKADWPKVVQITTDSLTNKGKDLHAAARLVEAATKVHGVAGLRDGLRVLHGLVTKCWDHLHPIPGEGDTTDIREAPVIWLNDNGRGARFPQTVAGMPVFRTTTGSFGSLDLRSKDRRAAVDDAVATAKPAVLETLRPTYADLLAARQVLQDLTTVLNERRIDKDSTPDYLSLDTPSNMGTAIERCIEMVEEIAKKRAFPLTPPSAETKNPAAPTGQASAGSGATDVASVGELRESLYRQLEQIAATLRRIEPHSPIPFLLERCVKLSALPFPQLMRAIIRENATLAELDRLLGITKEKQE
jgi:type VI secretion system protein ImpA